MNRTKQKDEGNETRQQEESSCFQESIPLLLLSSVLEYGGQHTISDVFVVWYIQYHRYILGSSSYLLYVGTNFIRSLVRVCSEEHDLSD